MSRSVASLLALAALTGCVTMTDLAWRARGPKQHLVQSGAQHAIARAEQYRAIHFDAAGLVCSDIVVPYVERAQLDRDVEHPNGYKVATQFFTVVELLAAALVVTLKEHDCARDGCGSRAAFYPWFAPLAVDLGWGIYRSFTLRDEIYRSTAIGWSGPRLGNEAEVADSQDCAPGTEIPLVAGGDTLTVRIGAGGRTPPHLLVHLGAFVEQHPSFGIGAGAGVRLDTQGTATLVAAARMELARLTPAPAAPVLAPMPTAPPPPALPNGVEVDVELVIPAPRR